MAGKANRKHGRSKRKPCDQRYKSEMRWEKNAARRKVRNQKLVAKKRAKLLKRRKAA